MADGGIRVVEWDPEPPREVVAGAARHDGKRQCRADDLVRAEAHHAVPADDDEHIDPGVDPGAGATARRVLRLVVIGY